VLFNCDSEPSNEGYEPRDSRIKPFNAASAASGNDRVARE